MANETLTGNVAALVATEKLAANAIAAHLPRMFFLQQVHHDSIDGVRAPKKRYPVGADLGMSSGGTEGVSVSNTVQFDHTGQVEVSTSEGVLDLGEVSEDAIMEALGIPSDQVERVLATGTPEQFEAILGPIINGLIPRGMQKIEYDGLQKLLGVATTIGTTNTEATLALGLQAIYQARRNQPLRPISEHRFIVDPSVVYEWNLEVGDTGGGKGGSVWVNQADYSLLNRIGPDFEATGMTGSLLRYPVFEYDPEIAPLANADVDVVGGFGAFGDPNLTPDDPRLAMKPGAFVYLVRSPLRLAYRRDLEGRSAKVRMNARYGWGELVDKNVTALVSKKRA